MPTFETWTEYRRWVRQMAAERPTEQECARRYQDAEDGQDATS